MRMILSALVLVALGASHAAAQNAVKNPGFEDPTVDMGSALGNWFRFGSAPNGAATESTAMPRSGARHIALETTGANQFAGVFQQLESPNVAGTARPIVPGATVTFSGWHAAVGTTNQTSELKIEWQGNPNPPQNRFDVINVPVGAYSQFTHTGVAPAGTTGAVITYAISTFGAGQTSDALVYVDDFDVAVVPEPATIGGLALGLVGLARIRRRK